MKKFKKGIIQFLAVVLIFAPGGSHSQHDVLKRRTARQAPLTKHKLRGQSWDTERKERQ